MKTFTVIDHNKPAKFFVDCVGCVLDTKKNDQVVIYTASGEHFNVGAQMLYDLRMRLYYKILEVAKQGGTIEIQDMEGLNEDQICVAIDAIAIDE